MTRTSMAPRLMALTAGLLLSSAVLAHAQTCTTRYNALLRHYETQCTPALPALVYPEIKDYAEQLQVAEQIKAQRLQNQILELKLQELRRQQAVR
jgi:hypothetical protein